jgi:hypothetical protein
MVDGRCCPDKPIKPVQMCMLFILRYNNIEKKRPKREEISASLEIGQGIFKAEVSNGALG